jgi:hypothetical protein
MNCANDSLSLVKREIGAALPVAKVLGTVASAGLAAFSATTSKANPAFGIPFECLANERSEDRMQSLGTEHIKIV